MKYSELKRKIELQGIKDDDDIKIATRKNGKWIVSDVSFAISKEVLNTYDYKCEFSEITNLIIVED